MTNEIAEVIETSIVNKEFNLINKKLQQHTKAIEKSMNATKRNMFEISARLLVIRDEELYKDDNYKDVFEYAESLFGYKKNMVYNLVTTAEKFIQPSLNAEGYQSNISHGNEDYTVSQLIELNSLKSHMASELDSNHTINPSMTPEEIRNAVKDFTNGVIRGSDEEGEQMEFVYSTGGRENYFKAEKVGDCVCRAICNATGKDYLEVYNAINDLSKTEKTGKRKKGVSSARNGVYKDTFKKYLASIGWEWVPTMQIGQGCKVHLDPAELPKGILIVSVSRHLTCVKNGVLYDTYDCTRDGNRCVYGYFKKASA